jgi:hypothetical protein
MFTEKITMTGNVKLELFTNSTTETTEIHNLVVNTGKNFMTSRLKDTTKAAMSHMAVGTDVTSAAVGQTALIAQLSNRVAIDSTTVLSNVITYVCTFGPGVCTGAITEAGIFNASTAGDMLARTTFAVINKSAADTLVITWTVTIS